MEKKTPGIQILIADGQPILRDGLKRLLESQPDFHVLADTGDGSEFVKLASDLKPDVALLGSKLSKCSAIDALRKIAAGQNNVRTILLVDAIQRSEIIEALNVGVRGVVLKSADSHLLFKSIRTVNDGAYWFSRGNTSDLVRSLRSLSALVEQQIKLQACALSAQQLQIVKAIVEGCSNKDIARELAVSERTVKYHLTRIFKKVGVSGRMELARYSLNHRLIREA